MAARAVNITDKGKRNPQPWTLLKAERSYYVHGLHGAKTATLAGAYGTKPEAMKAARRLANEEGEDVSISAPKGAMIVVHPNPATRKNLFGFGKGKDARRTTPAHGGIAYHQGKRKSRKTADDLNAEFLKSSAQKHAKSTTFKGRSIKPTEGGSWVVPSIDKESEFDTLQDAKAFITSWKRNPSPVIGGRPFKGGEQISDKVDAIKAQMDRVSITSKKWRELNKRKDALLKRAGDEFRIKSNPMSLPDQAVYFGGSRYWRRVYDVAKLKADGRLTGLVKFAGKTWRVYQVGGPDGHWDTAKTNPASGAAEVFEEFHGFEPSEVVTVTKHIHHHEHLAAAGKLTHLDVWGIDNKGHRIAGFKGAFLAFNENKNQLFVEGGDQSVNLEDFGIDSPHELETLGRLTDIGYQTNKTHLGSEGGEAVYVHKFRTTNDNGKHVTVRIARYPDLIYDVRNEQLLFSGGSYEILREGINK